MSALLDTVPPATAGGSRRRLRGCAYWRHRSAGHVLRHHLDPGEGGVEVALQGDVEILILGAGAVTGQVQGLFDQVQVHALSITATAARMQQSDCPWSCPPRRTHPTGSRTYGLRICERSPFGWTGARGRIAER